MKNSINLFGLIIVAFIAAIPSGRGAPAPDPYEIRLKSRRFVPSVDGARGAQTFRGGKLWHGFVQLERPLDTTQLAALKAAGIKIRHFVSTNTVAATIPAKVDPYGVAGVRWTGPVITADKVARSINQHAMVEFFPDTSDEEITNTLARVGAERQPHSSLPRHVAYVVLPEAEMAPLILAESETVYWVSDAPAAIIEGRKVHYCAGPMTIAGPVANYVLNGPGWDGPALRSADLTYYFGVPSARLGLAAQHAEILRALNTWCRYAAIHWTETITPNRSRSFDIHFVSGEHGDGDPFDGPRGVLAHCFYPAPPNPESIAGDMHLDADENWNIGFDIDLFSVALHEAGHGLGLSHSENSSAVMAPYYSGVIRQLHADDIAGIRELYAAVSDTPPENDSFANASALTGATGSSTGDNHDASKEPGEPNHYDNHGGKSVWFRWTAPFDGIWSFDSSGSSFDTLLAVYTGSSVNTLSTVAADDDSGDGNASRVEFSATSGVTYRIAVDGYDGAFGSMALRWSRVSSRPTITQQPRDVTVVTGEPITLSAIASGSPVLFYQWFKNRQPLPGATSSSLAIPRASRSDAGAYFVRVRTAAGFVDSFTAIVTVSVPDIILPRVTITSPTSSARVLAPAITVAGTASDDRALARVECQVNGGSWLEASGTTAWFVSFNPIPGVNWIRAISIDQAGNESVIASRSFTYVPSSPLSLRIEGLGTVAPNLIGKWLEVGRLYTVTASPGPGQLFAGWTGDVSAFVPQLAFVMRPNLVVQANFIANPFIASSGSYQGLFYSSNTIEHETSGYFSGQITERGSFTGALLWQGQRLPMAGRFALDGKATNFITRSGLPIVRMDLALDFVNSILRGHIGIGDESMELTADRAAYDARTQPCSLAGRYTIALAGSANASVEPGGVSTATAVVDASGKVSFVGTLADGTPVSQSTRLSREGNWPLYSQLYKSRGSMLGWLHVNPNHTNDISGLVSWIKPALATESRYPVGFRLETQARGGRYAPAVAGRSILAMREGTATFSGGALVRPFANRILLGQDYKLVNLGQSMLAGTFNPQTGTFKGKVTEPITGRLLSFSGVALQGANLAAGYFTDGSFSGAITIVP